MIRSAGTRASDVRSLVEAARAVVRERAAIAAEIASATGLSPEGVELAFTRHVEIDPDDAAIDALVAHAGDAEAVLVILSANVFVAALRAIALARAASSRVLVRPSRREPTFARALIERAGDPALTIATEADVAAFARGEIHVYGRDETIAAVRARAAPGAHVRGHGAGMGVAFVTSAASLPEAAASLAEDVVPFDQRGCLSPRVAIVEGDTARAASFAEALHDALAAAALRVPRGALGPDERAEAARYAATLAYAGSMYSAPSHVVGAAAAGAPLVIPPSGRHVHVAPAADCAVASALLAPIARYVVAIGSDDPAGAASIAPPHARLSPLGRMQRPPLDGPVDRRPH